MTKENEEAIEELKCLRENMLLSLGRAKALDKAIQALEAQPMDAVKLISLDDIMAQFPKANFNGDAIENKKAYPYWKTDIIGLISILKSVPTVIPQRKSGKWIFCEGIKGKDNVEKCSCCQSHWKEAVIYRNDTQEYLRLRLKYCPNCGAEMGGADEVSD